MATKNRIKDRRLQIMQRKNGDERNYCIVECDLYDMEAFYHAIKILYDDLNEFDYFVVEPVWNEQLSLSF